MRVCMRAFVRVHVFACVDDQRERERRMVVRGGGGGRQKEREAGTSIWKKGRNKNQFGSTCLTFIAIHAPCWDSVTSVRFHCATPILDNVVERTVPLTARHPWLSERHKNKQKHHLRKVTQHNRIIHKGCLQKRKRKEKKKSPKCFMLTHKQARRSWWRGRCNDEGQGDLLMYLLVLNVELRSVDHTNDAKPDWDHWQQRGSRTKQENKTRDVHSICQLTRA